MRLLSMTVCAAGMLVLASPAMAAGMPQLDASNPLLWWQLVWGAAIFVVLYALLRGSALPGVARVLQARRERIESDLDAARASKATADAERRIMHDEFHRAAAEAQELVARTVAEARDAATRSLQEMNAKLDAESEAAERRLLEQRTQALTSLPEVAAETANALIERLTGQAADRARVAAEVDGHLRGHLRHAMGEPAR